jgi:hypothetical protein
MVPEAIGLRPEVFKAGGDILLHQLKQDFGVIWPKSPGSTQVLNLTSNAGKEENTHISAEGASSQD